MEVYRVFAVVGGFMRLNANNRGNALVFFAIEARGLLRFGSLEILAVGDLRRAR